MTQAITHIFELLGHTYKLLTFIAWRIADLDDRAALTEEREWYSDFLRRVAGEE